jgi:MFS family permease
MLIRRGWIQPLRTDVSASLARCLDVLGLPTARAIAISTFLARLPKAMVPIAVVYFIHAVTGSYLLAGTVTAVIAIGDAATAPLQGRLVDRFGRGVVLIPSSILYAVGLLGLIVAARAERVSNLAVIACGAVVGIAFPPVSSAVKTVWALITADEARLAAAYTVESLIQQVLFLVGPLVVSGFLLAGSSSLPLAVAAVLTVLGTVAFTRISRQFASRSVPRARGAKGAIRSRLVRDLIATTWLQGLLFGILPIALPLLASVAGTPPAGAWLLTALAVGGLLGTFGSISPTSDVQSALARYARLIARFAVPMVLLAAVGQFSTPATIPLALCVLLAAGCFLTPIAASSYLIVGTATPADQRNEAFAWLSTAQACGSAAGSAIAGLTAERSGPGLTMVLPVLAVAAAAVVARWRLLTTSNG